MVIYPMLMDKIVPAIAQGRVFDIQVSHDGNKTSKLTYDGHFVALRKAKGSNVWLLAAFEKFEDGCGKEEGKTTPTEHQSYSSHTDAELQTNLVYHLLTLGATKNTPQGA